MGLFMGGLASTTRHPSDLLAAEVKLVEAQAEAKHAEAEAKHAEAEAKHAEAEATRLHTFLPLALGFSCTALLAADFYLHESHSHIRRVLLGKLRASTRPPSPAPRLLPVAQPRLELGFLPTMLLGPTGCGKSTLLASLAREAAASTPTIFVRLRLPSSKTAVQPSSAEEPAHRLLDTLARQVFLQLGYPTRRALVYTVPQLFRTPNLQFSSPSGIRLCDALQSLFEAMEELYFERVERGISPEEGAPVLLLDEVQDLIKSSRLADVGGREVFDKLAQLLVAYCVDRQVVRAAVAGSSALLSVEFDNTVASGSRWNYYELHDPEEGAVRAALVARGSSADDAQSLIALCGTRLRLLAQALKPGSSVMGARLLASNHLKMASRNVLDLFNAVSPAERDVLCRVLDAAEDVEMESGSGQPPRIGGEVTAALVLAASKVLFLRLSGELTFQSALHRAAWHAVRDSVCKPS